MRSTDRRHFLTQALTSLGLLAGLDRAAHAADDELCAVVHARNPTRSISASELKNICLGQTAFWNGTVPIKLFVRPPTSPAAERLATKVLSMTQQAFSQSWTSRQLAGQGMAPEAVVSAAEVLVRVKATPSALGFVLRSEVAGVDLTGVKLVPVA